MRKRGEEVTHHPEGKHKRLSTFHEVCLLYNMNITVKHHVLSRSQEFCLRKNVSFWFQLAASNNDTVATKLISRRLFRLQP